MPNSESVRILIVDDDNLNRRILDEVLSPIYTVLEAKDGKQALRRVQSNPAPDLILLDIMMPGMDGFAVLRALKDDPVTADIPVIFITGKDSQHDEEKGLRLGAVDYITKPLSTAVVLQRVRNRIDLERNTRALIEFTTRKEQLLSMVADDLQPSVVRLMDSAQELQRIANSEEPDQENIAAHAARIIESANQTQKLLVKLLN